MIQKPSVLLVDDDEAFRSVMGGAVARFGFDVRTAATGAEAFRACADHEPDLVLLDLQLPDMTGLDVLKALRLAVPAAEIIMLTGHGSIDTAIDAIRLGAFDYISKPCPLDELEVRMQRALERQALKSRAALLESGLTPPDVGTAFVGDSPEFKRAVELIGRVAPSDSTVLLTGETGTGKEMAAKLLHARSRRGARPFVVVECAALQESLLQSELFGHERGAFTGADRPKPGLFEVADGGTVFLDEIGEVSPATQVTLLRVLDTSSFRHVGGTREIRVDVRVIAATNRDLASMVRQGLFREDLYYRLATITIALPPLRDRAGDVAMLAGHFVARLNRRFGVDRRLDGEALARLVAHPWPGNVRELFHAIEAAVIVCDGPVVRVEHLPASVRERVGLGPQTAGSGGRVGDPSLTLEQLERAHVAAVLSACHGHRSQAARSLGISERNLYRKLRTYDLL